jgi:hypothetical protein
MSTNIPKVMSFYWDGSHMSYLQHMTVISFNKFNPDWEIVIYEPKQRIIGKTWKTDEQAVDYRGDDYYQFLLTKPFVKRIVVSFDEIGFSENVPEIYKSDFIRWKLLSTVGGGWSDMDVFYLKPLSTLTTKKADTIICYDNYHFIGFFLSKPKNLFFKKILDEIKIDFDKTRYQSIGSSLMNSIYPTINLIDEKKLGVKLLNILPEVIYPYKYDETNKLFLTTDKSNITENTIGVHWFNGDRISKDFVNSFKVGYTHNNTITELLNEIK